MPANEINDGCNKMKNVASRESFCTLNVIGREKKVHRRNMHHQLRRAIQAETPNTGYWEIDHLWPLVAQWDSWAQKLQA